MLKRARPFGQLSQFKGAEASESSALTMKSTKPRLVVVLGMHRSGTSAITRALVALGVELGVSLLPPDKDINDLGYWEDIDLNRLNVEMLQALETDWDHLAPIPKNFVARLSERGFLLRAVDLLRAKVGTSPVFGFKDPRVSLLLPFWKKVFPHCNVDVSYLLAIRNPISVIKSLAKRDQLEFEKSALLWLTHTVSSLEGMRGERSRTLIDYDRLMRAPESELNRVASELKLVVDPNELQIYVTQFLDQKLRHTTYTEDDLALSSFTESLVGELYAVLLDAASGELPIGAPAVLRQLTRSRGELDRWEYPLAYVDSLYHFKRKASQAITIRDAQVRESQVELARIRTEISTERQCTAQRDSAISALEKVGAERASQIQDLTARLERTQAELARDKQAEAHCNSTISALEKIGAERASQIQELNSRMERTEGELIRERQAVALCNSTIGGRESSLATLRQQVAEFQVRCERTQSESILEAQAAARRESAAKATEGALAEARSQSNELQSQLVRAESELREDILLLTVEGDSAQRSVAALQQTIGAYKQQVGSLMVERDVAQRNVATSNQTIAKQSVMGRLVEMGRAQLQAQLRESGSKMNDLEDAARTLQEQVRNSLEFPRVNSSRDEVIAGKRPALRSLLDHDGPAFVRAAYLALLRREPDADGQFYYWGRLRAGAPKLQILAEISRSAEGRRADCRIPGLKRALRIQRLAQTPIVSNVIASLLKLDSFGPSQTRLRALRQEAIHSSLSLDMIFERFAQSLQLLRDASLPQKHPEEIFIQLPVS